MEYHSVLERNGILAHTMTCTSLEDKMLSEIYQSQKDKCHTIPTIQGPRVVRFTEMESRMVAPYS